MTGFVSFVSAGPGDPELLTLKAARYLSEADVVLYDDLSSGPILDMVRAGADLVSVGKRAGRPSAKQDHVNALLVDYARTGARVVRLKSGDAGIFGRLEEEILALGEAGIAFDIVPGVPSPCAAAAAAGMPLTRRVEARRLQFVTGADVTGDLPGDLNWAALADPSAITCLFMGKRTLPRLIEGLTAHGLPPTTPALMAEAVGHPETRRVRGTLATVSRALAADLGTQPAIILYGPLFAPAPEA
jgi:uroporphyrin-III C-methyltransferase